MDYFNEFFSGQYSARSSSIVEAKASTTSWGIGCSIISTIATRICSNPSPVLENIRAMGTQKVQRVSPVIFANKAWSTFCRLDKIFIVPRMRGADGIYVTVFWSFYEISRDFKNRFGATRMG